MVHAQESGHWYDKTGKPVWEVTGAKGQPVAPDIRHARKLGLLPGTTSIIKCAAAPGLDRWKIRNAIMAALTHPGLTGTDEDIEIILKDASEQAKKASEEGTRIHAALQEYFEGGRVEYAYHCLGTQEAIERWAATEKWVCEKSFAHPMGYGGKTDLHSPGIVCDFKTKEFNEDTKLDTYPEHHMQLAAYREGLGMPTARCAIVYVSVTVPGLARVIEIPEDDLKRGWACFTALLAYWRAKNRIT